MTTLQMLLVAIGVEAGVISAMAAALVRMYREKEAQCSRLGARIDAVHEARMADSKAGGDVARDVLREALLTMNELSQTVGGLRTEIAIARKAAESAAGKANDVHGCMERCPHRRPPV